MSSDSERRWRVDLTHGYISFSDEDEDKAWDLYEAEGLRIRLCKNIFDEGEVVEGLPIDWKPGAAN